MAIIGEFYRILGVEPDAASDDIKRAFRRLARSCHPDVAGEDPEAAAQFGRIREAYETLADPERRARYDRQVSRPARKASKSHIKTHWRPPGGWDGFSGHQKAGAGRSSRHQTADVSLDDIFADPGSATADFGFGAKKVKPQRGEADDAEVVVPVEVPGRVGRLGGTVTVKYNRLRRSSDGVNVYNYAEIYDLRVPPKTCTGDVLREPRMGNFSKRNNMYADLVCRITVTEESGTHHPRRDTDPGSPPPKSDGRHSATPHAPSTGTVRISVVEAILGGRVRVETPSGEVKVSIPPGTSSGKMLRLKGQGAAGDDWHARVEVAVPRSIDDESRTLIERFAALNPMDPECD